jgi:hypothetical protein
MANLALNQACTSDSIYGVGYEANKAVDGSFVTFFNGGGSFAGGTNSSVWGTAYWQVDLGSSQSFSQINIYAVSGYSGRVGGLTVYYSNNSDGTGLTSVGSVPTPNSTSPYIFNFSTVTARYIRIKRTADSAISSGDTYSNSLTLAEVEVYGSSSPIFSGQPTLTALNTSNTGFNISVSGGAAPYTAQLHRGSTSGFTPSGGTTITGATVSGTTITAADSTATPGTTYFYKVVVTDSASNTITSNQIPGLIAQYKLQLLFIGDSITSSSYNTVPKTQARIRAIKRIFQVPNPVNAAVSGTRSNDWVGGSTNLNNAKASAVSAFGSPSPSNPIWVSVMLGVNDARTSPPGNSPATYKSNMQSMVNDLVGAGYKVILHAPPMIRVPQGASNGADTEAGMANLQGYTAQLDSLVDNVTVFAGDRQATIYFSTAWSEFVADDVGGGIYTYVHPNATGEDTYAALWSRANADAMFPNRRSPRSIRL